MFEEYNPDNPQEVAKLNKSEKDLSKRPKIQINDPRPFSPENPCYKIKYEQHLKMGIPMFQCPQCHFMGRHKVTELDQPKTSPYRIGGESCDICGDQDTYEMGF